MTELIKNKKDILEIINDKIKGKKLKFTDYYSLGIDQKGIPHDKVLKIFSDFNKVIAIERKTLKFGDVGYELFYKLDNSITFSIATCPKNNLLLIIHAIEYKRNLRKRLKE